MVSQFVVEESAFYVEGGSPANHSFGKSEMEAGFVMADYSITQRLRFSGGVRVENADLFTDVYKFAEILKNCLR